MEVVSLALDGKKCVGVKTSSGEIIHAAQVVLAAGCWSSQISGVASYAPTVPVRGQMVALAPFRNAHPPCAALRARVILFRAARRARRLWSWEARLKMPGYEKRVTSGGLEKILAAANALVPELAKAEIMETWSGLRPGTPDQLPILGPADIEGLVFATGHYRNGILLAPVTAKLVGEWIADRKISLEWRGFQSAALPAR